jgi:hypothetical protein
MPWIRYRRCVSQSSGLSDKDAVSCLPVIDNPTEVLIKISYPAVLSITTLVEVLHGEKSEVKKRLRVFYIGFTVLFFW